MPALEVADLHKRFGRVRALRGVSFALEPGEVFGFLGPNGAGKTTTLRILLGLVRADRGAARLLGGPAGEPASRERVGFVPGELRLPGGMTGHGVLEHFARFRPARPPVLRERLLDALDLRESDLRRRVKWLSHGTRQKLGLVAALQHDPDLVLLDEPTNGLDPLVQRAFRDVVRELAARGRAVLLSSHVLSEVEAVCGRVAVLRAGDALVLVLREVLHHLRLDAVHAMFDFSARPFLQELADAVRLEPGEVTAASARRSARRRGSSTWASPPMTSWIRPCRS